MKLTDHELAEWETKFEAFVTTGHETSDAAHDTAHVRRVVSNARALARAEGAELDVVLPAAWLHDCVRVPKDSPQRSRASRLSADRARSFLIESGYPAETVPAIVHAIEAHSFSAGIAPETLEACVVQDADRLDALGAVGIARAVGLGAQLGRPLYDPDEPFPERRTPSDDVSTIDHFYTKLLRLEDLMKTAAGRAEARVRTEFMRRFLERLGGELGSVTAPDP